ncbi:EscN/YscN/HrcN family type III secretion system ATPase [Brevundimonas intermedia]|uniref:EscN/YscN/HrcN family type III secretion system ATPase n=1 Tax=Brevundimonas intermedia TaxID=74315 RepID=A0ABQ5TDV1_9CAUL|nr:FliI/YscN family ATPase [Brevundimonas intermedia]GLK50159.1 EscN/YscN/HrcN family type III secretion system ATPase [Brevundimonas intermedia]
MSLAALTERLHAFEPSTRTGRVTRIAAGHVEADGPDGPIGAACVIEAGGSSCLATIVSVDADRVVLAPLDPLDGVRRGARVRLDALAVRPLTGDAFCGRVVDGLGRALDAGSAPSGEPSVGGTLPTLERVTSPAPLLTGVRAIDGLLPLATGQRVGVFAAPGVGKTTLVSQLASQVEADRCVICLVGERGREVEALWSKGLPESAKARTTVVAATSDQTAALRVQAVEQALALAGAWRARGLHVLFVLDSATRYAMALRELGLAAGEPPTIRAYTPSVFAALPKLVERCGAARNGGAISAVLTVLSETDDVDDPIVEVMKSLLDGHIVLSRRIAETGRFPAVDVSRSISRLAGGVMSATHRALAAEAQASIGAYDAARTLIEAGVYTAGADAAIDAAIRRRPALEAFLRQDDGAASPAATLAALAAALKGDAP